MAASRRPAFTIVELLVVIVVIGLLMIVLMPMVAATRESARRARCVSKLKMFGMALHNYHTAYESFPPMRYGPGSLAPQSADPLVPTILPNSNGDQLSGFVALLPYLQYYPVCLEIIEGGGTPVAPPWGPVPNPAANPVWDKYAVQVDDLLCPSDDGGRRRGRGQYGRSNYAFCLGDSVSNNDWVVPDPVTGDGNFKPPRGIFGWHTGTRISHIRDGTSNTLAMSERTIGTDPNRIKGGIVPALVDENFAASTCLAYAGAGGLLTTSGVAVSGRCWVNGHACFVGFTTCLPPNAPSCGMTAVPARYAKGGSGGIYSPSSYHPGGVNCLVADGSVRFIGENIDAGDPKLSEASPMARAPSGQTSASPSRWGVWGVLGSKASDEQPGRF